MELTEAEQAELDALWAPEIRRRIEEIDSGRVKMIPWDEAKAELWKLIGARPKLSARALSDIRAQVLWYNEQNAIAAGGFCARWRVRWSRSRNSPRRWPVFSGRVRRAMLRPFPF